MPIRTANQGFTLTELLVVMAIIAILAAMLLPGIALVRGVAQATRCASNLRQVGMATSAYTQDWRGVHAPLKTRADWASLDPAAYPYGVHWHDLTAPYVEGDGERFGANNFRGVLWGCPAWRGAGVGPGLGGVNGGWTGYGRNYRLAPFDSAAPWGFWCDAPEWSGFTPGFYRYISVAMITRPSERALIAESSDYFSYEGQGDGRVAPLNACFDRHRGRTNVMFCDLHMERLPEAGVALALHQE